ncbi:hypothetical protein JTB14_036079 [Gonioctena quinquepunctata]|nr:hypothetical protein JTB14_036079 [Gonioctena quinquepunctata]
MPRTEFISFSHFNVRSLLTGFDMFSDFMQEECLDICSISETWLNQSFPSRAISVPDYNLIRKDRQGKKGGGLAFYIKKSIKYKIVDDGNHNNSSLETFWISVNISGKKICIGTLYRPPTINLTSCLIDLENIISSIIPQFDFIILGGDFNVDILNETNNNTKTLWTFFEKYNLFQKCNEPTRITATSSTCIDLLVSTDSDVIKNVPVSKMDGISEHCLVKCEIKCEKEKFQPKFVSFRDFSHFNYNNFLRDLDSIDWDYIFDMDDVLLEC